MTAKERAKYIVEQVAIYHWVDGVCRYEEAKQSALLVLKQTVFIYLDQQSEEIQKYWLEVEKEIKSL